MTGAILSIVWKKMINRGNEEDKRPYLLYHAEAVHVVAVEDVRAHESKDRHQVVNNRFACKWCDVCNEKKRLVERLRVARS
jgi:hypothetical protein